jgi:hypothetical protein
MADQNFPATDSRRKYVLDLLKIIFIAATPPIIMFLGAVVAVDAARELNETIAKIKEPIDKAMTEEFKEKLHRPLFIWSLIPALQLCVAAFAHVAGSIHNERLEDAAALAYIAGLFSSLIACTLYEPFFALFTEPWRRLTMFAYIGSAEVVYVYAIRRLLYKDGKNVLSRL